MVYGLPRGVERDCKKIKADPAAGWDGKMWDFVDGVAARVHWLTDYVTACSSRSLPFR